MSGVARPAPAGGGAIAMGAIETHSPTGVSSASVWRCGTGAAAAEAAAAAAAAASAGTPSAASASPQQAALTGLGSVDSVEAPDTERRRTDVVPEVAVVASALAALGSDDSWKGAHSALPSVPGSAPLLPLALSALLQLTSPGTVRSRGGETIVTSGGGGRGRGPPTRRGVAGETRTVAIPAPGDDTDADSVTDVGVPTEAADGERASGCVGIPPWERGGGGLTRGGGGTGGMQALPSGTGDVVMLAGA